MPALPKRSSSLNNTLIFSFLLAAGLSFPSADPNSTIYFSGIEFKVIGRGNFDRHFIWIHGDEKTAEMALNYHMKHYPGKAFFIQSDEREVPLASTKADPNRLFSRKGSEAALRKFKVDWRHHELSAVLDRIDSEREKFLDELFPGNGGLLIAVHNNFRGYNVNSELPISRMSSIKKDQNPRDFILCTNESDYHKLASGPFNVLLQDQIPIKDNGSLSWAALRKGVRYINIETRLGWLSQQKKMLKFVEESLK